MKYVDEFRDVGLAKHLAAQIGARVEPGRRYRLMEFCGGHTHAIFRYGLPDLLPANIELIHGPGCPVCVLPMARIDAAIELALHHGVILCSYGDMLRVPGSQRSSLLKARAQGADIRILYSPADALQVAAQHPDRQVVLFAVGFETTTPPTSVVLQQAIAQGVQNFSIFCNHLKTPAAVAAILEPGRLSGQRPIDGLIGPGHVSLISGADAYRPIAQRYGLPILIAGFEPVDLLQAILRLVEQINGATTEVENQYLRAVSDQGNQRAQRLIDTYFETRPTFEWRGLGWLANSALQIREAFSYWDAERRFPLSGAAETAQDNRACQCPAVLRGDKKPPDCKLFANGCTPENPIGACMVSSEGACAAYYNYRRD